MHKHSLSVIILHYLNIYCHEDSVLLPIYALQPVNHAEVYTKRCFDVLI